MLVCLFVCLFEQVTIRLDSQSKSQMFTLFSGRHVGVPQRYTNMAASYWALLIYAKYFAKYLKFRKRANLKLEEVSSLSISYNITGS